MLRMHLAIEVPCSDDLHRCPIINTSIQYTGNEPSIKQIRRIAYQIIAPILITTGILGNILNLIVLSRPFFNSCTRTYLRALAIADINILLFDIATIIRLCGKENTNAFTAFYHAYAEIPIVTTFITFNVYIVTCLTVDRYISVCAPTKFNSFHTPKKAKTSTLIAISIAITLCMPLVLLKTTCRISNTNHWSFKDNISLTSTDYWYTYIIISEIMIRTGPAIFVTILNILIIRKFKIITRKRYDSCNTNIKLCIHRIKKYQEEKRLVILLQIIVVLFGTTMIPSSFLSLWYTTHPSRDYTFEVFRAVANLLEMTNFALNFCAYFLCSQEFRKGLLSIFINPESGSRNINKKDTEQPNKPIGTVSINF